MQSDDSWRCVVLENWIYPTPKIWHSSEIEHKGCVASDADIPCYQRNSVNGPLQRLVLRELTQGPTTRSVLSRCGKGSESCQPDENNEKHEFQWAFLAFQPFLTVSSQRNVFWWCRQKTLVCAYCPDCLLVHRTVSTWLILRVKKRLISIKWTKPCSFSS